MTEIYVSTGDVEIDRSRPILVFLPGAGGDHRTWDEQLPWFSERGFSVIAPDFPAHSQSDGQPLLSVEASAQWLHSFLVAANVQNAHFVGHSLGFLTALEFAASFPIQVLSLIGVGTAAAIPVNSALIKTATSSTADAAELMGKWSFGPLIKAESGPQFNPQLIEDTVSTMAANPLAEDLRCCDGYQGGESAMATLKKLRVPCALILSEIDKMTPLKEGVQAAQKLEAEITIIREHGHMLPMEAPIEINHAILRLISKIG